MHEEMEVYPPSPPNKKVHKNVLLKQMENAIALNNNNMKKQYCLDIKNK